MFDFSLPSEFDSSSGDGRILVIRLRSNQTKVATPLPKKTCQQLPGWATFPTDLRCEYVIYDGVAMASPCELHKESAPYPATDIQQKLVARIASYKQHSQDALFTPMIGTGEAWRGERPLTIVVNGSLAANSSRTPLYATSWPLRQGLWHLMTSEQKAWVEAAEQEGSRRNSYYENVLSSYGFKGALTEYTLGAAWRKVLSSQKKVYREKPPFWKMRPGRLVAVIEGLAKRYSQRLHKALSLDLRPDHSLIVAGMDERVRCALEPVLIALRETPHWLFVFGRECLELAREINVGANVAVPPPGYLPPFGHVREFNRWMVANRSRIEWWLPEADKRPKHGPHVNREEPKEVCRIAESESKRALQKFISTGIPTEMKYADVKRRIFDDLVQQACMVSLTETRTAASLPLLGWHLRMRMRDRLDRDIWKRRGPGDIDHPDTISMSGDNDEDIPEESAQPEGAQTSTAKHAPPSSSRFIRRPIDLELLIKRLKARERVVLELALKGFTQDEIAASCRCDQSRVSRDLRNISAEVELLEASARFNGAYAAIAKSTRRDERYNLLGRVSLERFRVRWQQVSLESLRGRPQRALLDVRSFVRHKRLGWYDGLGAYNRGHLVIVPPESATQRPARPLLPDKKTSFYTWPEGPTCLVTDKWKREFGMRYDTESRVWRHEPEPGDQVVPSNLSDIEELTERRDERGAAMRYVVSLLSWPHKIPESVEYGRVRDSRDTAVNPWRGADGKWYALSPSVLGGTCFADKGFPTALAARAWVQSGTTKTKFRKPA